VYAKFVVDYFGISLCFSTCIVSGRLLSDNSHHFSLGQIRATAGSRLPLLEFPSWNPRYIVVNVRFQVTIFKEGVGNGFV
jgi:hypothetical protein